MTDDCDTVAVSLAHTHTPLNIHYVKKNDCTHATKDTVGLYTPFNDKKRKSNTVIYLFILYNPNHCWAFPC